MSNNILKHFLSISVLGLLVCHTWFAAPAAINLTPPSSETFSFQCQDQAVKVESDIYHVDRLRSSLKSNYFENIFTSGDFKQKNDKVLEIQLKNAEVFASVIDLIHGKKLIDVLNKDNHVELLETMDHLEMEIDLQIVSSFIDDNLKSYSPKDAKIFELYNFTKKNSKFTYLLTSIFEYFSPNLTTVRNDEILPSLTLDHLIRIIKSIENVDDEKRYEIVQTCIEWLCCDLENRLPHVVILTNSIKSGFHRVHENNQKNGTVAKCLPKINIDKQAKREIISECVFALLSYGGKLNPNVLQAITDSNSTIERSEDKIEEKKQGNKQKDSPSTLVNSNKMKKSLHTAKGSGSPKTNVNELAIKNIDMKHLFGPLSYGGAGDPSPPRNKELPVEHFGVPSGKTNKSEVEEKADRNEYKQNNSPVTLVNSNNEYDKMKKFLENGDFYDITVRVGEKVYKLHRAVLESRCGYFADIFRTEYSEAVAKCDGIPTLPCREQEYLLDVVDQSTFDAVIDHIYFDKNIGKEFNDTSRISRTANVLKIDSLLENLKEWLEDVGEEVSSQDVIEVLKGTRGKMQFEGLYLIYLCKHISTKWPEIDDVSQFCSISGPMLENLLKSPHLRLHDPYKILDICSTWVIHDVKNRYSFLPRIAQAVNPNCVVDKDEYKIGAPAELNNCSQQFVRDKLWQILSTSAISYIAPSEELAKNETKKFEKIPIFVTSKEGNPLTIDVLNADLNVIASFSSSTGAPNNSDDPLKRDWERGQIKSAAMIDDNVFILLIDPICRDNCEKLPYLFQVCSISLKQCFLLPFYADNFSGENYTLFNCNNEIYSCSPKTKLMKFSTQLNRWLVISKHKSNDDLARLPSGEYELKKYSNVLKRFVILPIPKSLTDDIFWFTSDGEKLYRMYYVSVTPLSYAVEPYDFENHKWSHESGIPLIKDTSEHLVQLNVANDDHLAVFTDWNMLLFDHKSKTWLHYCDIPTRLFKLDLRKPRFFAQCKDEMLLLVGNKLYNFSHSMKEWKLKKEVPGQYESREIAVIHRSKFVRIS